MRKKVEEEKRRLGEKEREHRTALSRAEKAKQEFEKLEAAATSIGTEIETIKTEINEIEGQLR